MPRPTATALLLLAACTASALRAQTAADSVAGFGVREAMIPMRDGVALHTLIYRPSVHHGPLPFLMVRTPYGITGRAARYFGSYLAELNADGYLVVLQDIRGRYASQGAFVMNRPLRAPADSNGVDESTDTWDTVDWLVHHVPDNNGRVGVLGISYPGWLAAMAGIRAHPAVRAISPQAPMTDTWIGDDFFHQGAFRLSYGFEYAADMELSNDGSVPLPITRYDTYDWYLAQGPLSNLTALLAGRVPTWTNFTRHPTYDEFWKARSLPTYLTELRVPTLTVGGWWDQEDFYGALATYAALERLDTAGINYLAMGPWNHGGWVGAGDSLGQISFRDSTGAQFRRQIQAPWFAYWLKDQGRLTLPEASLFVAGENRWRGFDRWPPAAGTATTRRLYFHADGGLSFDPPQGRPSGPARAEPIPKDPRPPRHRAVEYDQYVSDPAHPVPYRRRPIQQTYDARGSGWYTWQVEDQRLVHQRPDVLSWETAPLSEAVTIAGDVIARLYASTTGQDADWVVKLIDVYPDTADGLEPHMFGFQLMVSGDILRGRYRHGWDRPTPLVPNRVAAFTVDLHQQAYTFGRGHRIMVQVQSTWFPAYDRNPQTWVPNIFEARPASFRAQTHRVYRSASSPSHVEVRVITP